jgi:hypothetical protein
MGFQDKELLFLDDEDYDASPAVIDIGYAFQPGSGYQLRGRVSCAGGDAAGTTALVITTGATSGLGTTVATLPMTHTQMNAGFNFNLPITGLLRYIGISLTGASAGTGITAGLALDVQTA